jgi:Cu-Zn family superoxide dismutase
MKFLQTPLTIGCIILVSSFLHSCNNEGNKTDTTVSADSNSVISADSAGVDNTKTNTGAMSDTATAPTVSNAVATISGTYPDTAVNGSVTFETAADGKIKMKLDITVAAKANKTVAVHIHEHGDCGDNGKASHGHWNPTNAQHGKWGSASFHAGDIGNVKLNAKGKGSITITTDLWTLGGKADKNILGKAMIVHGGTDDYTTQPTGNAGSRIGCGLIQGK